MHRRQFGQRRVVGWRAGGVARKVHPLARVATARANDPNKALFALAAVQIGFELIGYEVR